MRKGLLIYLLLHLFIKSSAQDTLRTNDLPLANSIYILSNGIGYTGMDARLTGPGYDWDYSALGHSSQQIDTMFLPSATNQLLSFFFINSPFNSNASNHATRADNFNLGIIGLKEVFNYYYNTPASYTQPGFGAIIDSIPVPVAYTPHDVLYKFPLKYGDRDTVMYHYDLNLVSTLGLFYRVNRTRINKVDGWGTLTTPYGTFDAVRIRSSIVEQDSIYVDTFHLGVKTPPVHTYEYKWLAKGFGMPLLQINTNDSNQVMKILYQDSLDLTAIKEIPVISDEPRIFPNPASDKIFVTYDLTGASTVSFSLFDLTGKQIFIEEDKSGTGKHFKLINIQSYNLSPGNYFLKIASATKSFTKKIQIGN